MTLPFTDDQMLTGFTTDPSLHYSTLVLVGLDDKELGVHRVTPGTTHNLDIPPVPVPTGDTTTQAWEAIFPKDSINPGNKTSPHGGFGFYLRGPTQFTEALKGLEGHAEVVLGYSVLFEEGFEFVKGGKLPGIYGGAGGSAYGCTGGRQTDRCRCFDLRLMWREGGIGELYAYLPQTDSNTQQLLQVPPESIPNPQYGFSVGRGAFEFAPKQWKQVAQRVKMNGLGKEDGEIEVYIDGKSRLHATGLVLRTNEGPDGRVQGLHMQTFFGGHTPDWASPQTQRAWFANIWGAILKPAHEHDEL